MSSVDHLRGRVAAMATRRELQLQEIEQLAGTLKDLGVGQVRVSKRGWFGFGRIESFIAVVGDHSYQVIIEGGRTRYRMASAVRGIGLDHRDVAQADWFQQLLADIDALAGPGAPPPFDRPGP